MFRDQFPPESAPERYAAMGLPKGYKITLAGESYLYGLHVGVMTISLWQWQETFTRFRKKSKGFQWVHIQSRSVSPTSTYFADRADVVAKGWIYDIQQRQELRSNS